MDLPAIIKIINLDPSLTAKLIQVANSPLYRGVSPVVSCQDAITRIGLLNTRNIVTSMSLSGLYRTRRKEIDRLMRYYWKQSVVMAALSYVLAIETKMSNAEEAMLAGLTCQIGIIPFLKFVDSQPASAVNSEEIKAALAFVNTTVSTFVLKKWNFPDEICEIPSILHNWFTIEATVTPRLADVLVLAHYHHLLNGKNTAKLPPITALASFSHLKNGELTPEKSLKILADAQNQVKDVMQIFPA